jgi:solute carrier family 35 protein F5
MLAQFLFTDAPDVISPFFMTYIGVALFALLLPLKNMTDRYYAKGILNEPCAPVPIDTTNTELEIATPYYKIAAAGLPEEANNSRGCNNSVSSDTSSQFLNKTQEAAWTHRQHFWAAAPVAPVWFIANWAYNAALGDTSIASSTVLASMCSVFSLGLAIAVGDEKFSYHKVIGCMIGISGTLLTALHDFNTPDGEDDACAEECKVALRGDLLALFAAFGFSINAVQLRVICPKNEDLYSMQLLLGYVGLVNLVVLSPYAFYHLAGELDMTLFVFGLVVVRGLFDYVISDFLHFRAVVLTNATVASVGLGLTIPMAFCADYFIGASHIVSPESLLGATAVMVSFVVVVIDTAEEDHGDDIDDDRREPLHNAETRRMPEIEII